MRTSGSRSERSRALIPDVSQTVFHPTSYTRARIEELALYRKISPSSAPITHLLLSRRWTNDVYKITTGDTSSRISGHEEIADRDPRVEKGKRDIAPRHRKGGRRLSRRFRRNIRYGRGVTVTSNLYSKHFLHQSKAHTVLVNLTPLGFKPGRLVKRLRVG